MGGSSGLSAAKLVVVCSWVSYFPDHQSTLLIDETEIRVSFWAHSRQVTVVARQGESQLWSQGRYLDNCAEQVIN